MKKEKTISTPELLVYGNIMSWNESMIQLSNISSISTVKVKTDPFPLWTLLFFVIGIFAFKFLWLFAIPFIAISVLYIFSWYTKYETLKEQRNLVILMNSGITINFIFEDQDFLKKVFSVIKSIISQEEKNEATIKINIFNSTISGNAKILNDLSVL